MEGQHVILYLDEIDKVSFSFKIYQSAVVKKTKPAAVTVYDYYETGKETDWRQKGVLYGENLRELARHHFKMIYFWF